MPPPVKKESADHFCPIESVTVPPPQLIRIGNPLLGVVAPTNEKLTDTSGYCVPVCPVPEYGLAVTVMFPPDEKSSHVGYTGPAFPQYAHGLDVSPRSMGKNCTDWTLVEAESARTLKLNASKLDALMIIPSTNVTISVLLSV